MHTYLIDSNFLRAAEARSFFLDKPDCLVVLSDYVIMEAYKVGSLEALALSFSVLGDYSNRVLVLKGTQELGKLSVPSAGMSEAMIDIESTRGFGEYCELISAGSPVREALLEQFNALAMGARNHLSEMARGLSGIGSSLEDIAQEMPKEGLAQLRRGESLSVEMDRHIRQDMLQMAGNFLRAFGVELTGASVSEYGHRFQFRFAVVAYLLVLRWLAKGATKGVNAEKRRNDLVDALIVAQSTYFGGVLTLDQGMNELSAQSEHAFDQLFGIRVGPL